VLDLTDGVLVTPAELAGPERKAVAMLLDEVEKRTQVRWRQTHVWPAGSDPVIAVGPRRSLPSPPSGTRIEATANEEKPCAAPEQMHFCADELLKQGRGPLVDVYLLGGIIYWVLYHWYPNGIVEGTLMQDLIGMIDRPGPPPRRELRPALRASAPKGVPDLERIVLKALDREPRRRYPAVSEMVADLEKWLLENRDSY
jgi:hypothetical protein